MIKVTVPATTANLGPGYDCLGMALSQYAIFECEKHNDRIVLVDGLECKKITTDNNLVTESMECLFEYIGKYPDGYKLHIHNNIPLARGMGSSASAIVGGLMCANYLMDFPLDQKEILKLATKIEGHPDNVAPSILGNLVLSTVDDSGDVIYHKIEPFRDLSLVLFVPDYEVSTSDSRKVVPQSVSISDTVRTSSRLSLMLMGFMSGNLDLISSSMDDCLHEPYRKHLVKGFDELKKTAISAGAFSYCLSGAGSTVISYCKKEVAKAVQESLNLEAQKLGIGGQAIILDPCRKGVQYTLS